MKHWDYHWKREYPFWYGVVVMYSLVDWIKEETGQTVAVRGEGLHGWFSIYSADGSKKPAYDAVRQQLAQPGFAQGVIDRIDKNGKAFVECGKRMRFTAETSDAELFALLDIYLEKFKQYGVDLFKSFHTVEVVSNALQELVVKEVPPDKVLEVVAALSKPSGKAKLASMTAYFAAHPDRDERIAYMKEHYPFMRMIDPFTEPHTDNEIEEYVDAFTPPKQQPASDITLSNTQLVKEYQDVLYMKDKRDDYRRESFCYAQPLFRECAKRLGITLQELGCLLPSEFGSDIKQLVKDRQLAYIAEIRDGKVNVRQGNVLPELLSAKESETANKVGGITGNGGKVKAKVQVISSMDDIPKFKEGNVLVAVTTSPEHVIAMEKAAAFVTDEGGIACHAAIVAREMNKPCVVGTQHATSSFKDGDLIEVDADKGIVRKVR